MIATLLLFCALQDREPVPPAAALKEAEKLVKGIFKDDYAKGDKKALARKLLLQGRETTDDLAAKFVLLREARDVAAQAGDSETALRAIDSLSETFDVDGPSMKNAALAIAGKNAKVAEEFRSLAFAYAKVADEAAARDAYDTAEKSAKAALDFARKAKDTKLTTDLDERAKEIAELKGRFDKAKKAREKLLQSPDDPAANSVVGFFLCAVKGDWAGGLPMLAKGDDPALKELAERDLGDPTSSTDQAAVGDGWWDRAEKETGFARKGLRARAGTWYEKAAPGLSGLAKTKAEKRLLEIRKEKYKDGWENLSDSVTVRAASGNSKTQELQGFPADEIDGFSVRVGIALGVDVHGAFIIGANEWSVGLFQKERVVNVCKFDAPGNKWVEVKQGLLTTRDEYLVTARLTGGDLVVAVDGQEKVRIKVPQTRITSITLQADYGDVLFSNLRVHHK